jgi:hypothetical protein
MVISLQWLAAAMPFVGRGRQRKQQREEGRLVNQVKRAQAKGDDLALREDIRFLGRLLGDTLRERVFELVESIRRSAITYRRDHDPGSLRTLDRTIASLDQQQATHVVRRSVISTTWPMWRRTCNRIATGGRARRLAIGSDVE